MTAQDRYNKRMKKRSGKSINFVLQNVTREIRSSVLMSRPKSRKSRGNPFMLAAGLAMFKGGS